MLVQATNNVNNLIPNCRTMSKEHVFSGGSPDFAGSPLAWIIFQLVHNLKWIGSGVLVIGTMALMWWNRVLIIRNEKAMIAAGSDRIQSME